MLQWYFGLKADRRINKKVRALKKLEVEGQKMTAERVALKEKQRETQNNYETLYNELYDKQGRMRPEAVVKAK